MNTKAATGKNLLKTYLKTNLKTTPKNKSKNKKGHIWEYVAIATIPLVLVLGNSMLVPILPDMQEKMGISRFQSSLVITLFSITAGLIIPVSGYLSDRFTRKAVIIPSLIVYGSAGVLAGFAAVWNSYPILILHERYKALEPQVRPLSQWRLLVIYTKAGKQAKHSDSSRHLTVQAKL